LATAWAKQGHHIYLGVKDIITFKRKELLNNPLTSVHPIPGAVGRSEVILLATPATVAVEVTKSLGDTTGKIIIDAMNIVMGRGPQGYKHTTEAILDNTQTTDVVKCFNTTGFNNMVNPLYGDLALDMFVASESMRGKKAAIQLAKDAGFVECYDIGGNDNVSSWSNSPGSG
jgi:predicted dinucleotide-binding enzyme